MQGIVRYLTVEMALVKSSSNLEVVGSNTATAEGRKDENKSNKRILEKVEKNDLNFDFLH